MAEPKKFYWDACIWISLINEEEPISSRCKALIEMARRGLVEIWTSSISLAEVYKKKCDGDIVSITEEKDSNFENFIEQDFLVVVQVDHRVGIYARRLLRSNSILRKPNDAIHLASAALNNLDEFHTSDRENLLPLDGEISCEDGRSLKICLPPEPPLPAPPPPQEGEEEKEEFQTSLLDEAADSN